MAQHSLVCVSHLRLACGVTTDSLVQVTASGLDHTHQSCGTRSGRSDGRSQPRWHHEPPGIAAAAAAHRHLEAGVVDREVMRREHEELPVEEVDVGVRLHVPWGHAGGGEACYRRTR